MKRISAFFLVILFVCLCFASCADKNKDPKKDVFTVSFSTSYLSSSALTPSSASVTRGETVSEPNFSYEAQAGYVVRWVRDIESPAPYDFSSPVGESFTLYALELPRPYSITYLLQMGKNSPANPASYDKNSEITFFAPTAPFGYKFLKWCYYDDPNSSVTGIKKGSEGDVVLRAVFSPVSYEVLYYGLEGAENPNPAKYVFGETLSLESPLREGYIFEGFTILGDKEGAVVSALTPSFVSENKDAIFKANGSSIILFANWEEIK